MDDNGSIYVVSNSEGIIWVYELCDKKLPYVLRAVKQIDMAILRAEGDSPGWVEFKPNPER